MSAVRVAVGTLGELLVTAGVLALLESTTPRQDGPPAVLASATTGTGTESGVG